MKTKLELIELKETLLKEIEKTYYFHNNYEVVNLMQEINKWFSIFFEEIIEQIKITDDMMKHLRLYGGYIWNLNIKYNDKIYYLHLYNEDEPSRDDWEKELTKKVKGDLKYGTN